MFISDIRSSTSDILYKCNQLVKNYSKFDSIKDVPHCRHIAQLWLRLFFHCLTPLVGLDLVVLGGLRSHSFRHAKLGGTPLDEWSTCHRDLYLTTHTAAIRDRLLSLMWDSNPQSQQPSGRRPTPYTVRLLRPATKFRSHYLLTYLLAYLHIYLHT